MLTTFVGRRNAAIPAILTTSGEQVGCHSGNVDHLKGAPAIFKPD
jgi:hypothetical protein